MAGPEALDNDERAGFDPLARGAASMGRKIILGDGSGPARREAFQRALSGLRIELEKIGGGIAGTPTYLLGSGPIRDAKQ